MTSSTVDFSWSVQPEKSVRLKSLRTGLRRVENVIRRSAASQTSFSKLIETEDYVRCIQHEVRFLEEYPAQALGRVQKERLEHLCNGALNLLDSDVDQSFLPLQEAVRNLMPLLAKDFDEIRRAMI